MARGRAVALDAIAEALQPDREVGIVEWIESNVILEEAETASPGQYRFRRTPYLREIVEALGPESPVQYVTTMKGSQLGFTICMGSVVCFLVAESPCSIILVSPTLDLAKRASRRKVGPMLNSTEAVRAKLVGSGSRKAADSVLMKEFRDAALLFAGANSGAGLRQLSARVVMLDELDVFPPFIPNEGDPERLAQRAAKMFSRRKIWKNSTPTIQGRSRVETNFEKSDRSRFFVPCPSCGEMQVLWFTDPKTGRKCLRWEGGPPTPLVWYECVKCEAKIFENKKAWMLERGAWRAEVPALSDFHRGFHLSSLYAAPGTYSWVDLVNEFIDAGKDQTKLCAFVNQALAETWVERGDAPPWETLYRRREGYAFATVPQLGLVVVAGADVQRDRIEVEIVAFGRGMESWSIDYVVIPGDTAGPEPWEKLATLLDRPLKHEGGLDLRIRALGVDSSWETSGVYNWVRRWPADRVFAIKGQDHLSVLVGAPTYVDFTWRGKKAYRAVRLWHVGTSVAKRELYGWLRLEPPLHATDGELPPPGFCHFPMWPENYFKGLTAEVLVPEAKRGGGIKYVWKVNFERNEPLDCRVYARAAAAIIGLDRYGDEDWKRLELELWSGLKKGTDAPPAQPARGRPKEGGFFQRWPGSRRRN